ncbi:DNA polymerase III subunit beta [bacterium]|nr:DNA polymerase III subunit beta [bacterium]
MKVIIGRNELFEGLQHVFNVVPQKPTLPVLTNFLIRVSDGSMSISGTDMDIAITTVIDCTTEGEGAVTVNAKRLINIIRELPEEDITLTIDGERIGVSFSRGESVIMGMSSSDYPALKETVEGITTTLSGADFVEMVDKTGFSVAVDRTRLSLTGVFWQIASDKTTMVSTDGHRLSLSSRKLPLDVSQEAEAIVPPKALNQAARMIAAGIELRKVVFGDGIILFDFPKTIIFSKLIEGPYPNFMQVIPANNSKHVFVSTELLSAAVRRVSVLSNTITHQIKLSITPGSMELSTTNADIGGEARENLQVRYDGEPITVGYNASFLQEILRKIETEESVLDLELPNAAGIIKPVGLDESLEYIYLIMPLRINE